MKRYLYLLLVLWAVTAGSCLDNDEVEGIIPIFDRPEVPGNSPADRKAQELLERYNTYCKYVFSQEEYAWNWNDKNLYAWSPADADYVPEVLDSIETWIFKAFPQELVCHYGPLNMLLVDSLGNWNVDYDVDIVDGEWVVIEKPVFRFADAGILSTNYVALAPVSARFAGEDKETLRFQWCSWYVEKMFANLTYPADFAAISSAGYETRLRPTTEVVKAYAFLRNVHNNLQSAYMSVAQDFADYVTFILYTPSAEKEQLYAGNELIRVKEELVKEYFREHYQWTLPEAK